MFEVGSMPLKAKRLILEDYMTFLVDMLLGRSDLQSTKDNINHAGAIVKRLYSHPLALTQAAAYMKSSHIGLQDFLVHYNTQKVAILWQTPKLT